MQMRDLLPGCWRGFGGMMDDTTEGMKAGRRIVNRGLLLRLWFCELGKGHE